MNNKGNLGIATVILILSFILIAATAASVITRTSSQNNLTQQDVNQMVNEAVDEISTYIQVKDMIGKYTKNNNNQEIHQVALLLKPFFTIDLDVSTLTVKLDNGEQIQILRYSQKAEYIGSQSLFEHNIWEETPENTFSLLVLQDTDNSMVQYGTINENTDMAYLLISLSEDFALKSGETLTVTLFPSTGITRTLTLTAPLPMHSVISFE